MLTDIAVLSEALLVRIAVVADKLVALADDGFGAEVLAAAALLGLRELLRLRVINSRSLDGLAEAVLVRLALRVALQNVVASAVHAASR